jgi:hypothetical protein
VVLGLAGHRAGVAADALRVVDDEAELHAITPPVDADPRGDADDYATAASRSAVMAARLFSSARLASIFVTYPSVSR